VLSPSADGRNNLAQGESPGKNGPRPLLFPLPRLAGEGARGKGRAQDPRLTPWATLFRPDKSGLTYAMNFSYGTLAPSSHEERA